MTSVGNRRNGGGGGNETYTFASEPRVVPPQRKKYRPDGNLSTMPMNIMHDPRIIRGNTYASQTFPATAAPDPIEIQRQQEMKRRAAARRRALEQMKPRTPEPVLGRKHIDVQTELYLEELTDRVAEQEVETQTDAFLDRPPSPLFVPAKTGVDMSTQIEEGDLWDFGREVKPLLEVLVGKTLEQALVEVMEEEELANLRQRQAKFEELRNAELAETQRMEEAERRRQEEKERRLTQQREVLAKETEALEKVAARSFAQGYLADLVPSVFDSLTENGYFYDTVEREVETSFLPWLMDQVDNTVSQLKLARACLDSVLMHALMKRREGFQAWEADDKAKAANSAAPEASAAAAAAAAAEAAAAEAAAAEAAAAEAAAAEAGPGGDDDDEEEEEEALDDQ